MLKITAPAKINLTLEVLAKRSDGYHEIKSVIQAIDLCDTLSFEKGEGLNITCDDPNWEKEKSLIFKAVNLLADDLDRPLECKIHLSKRIPLLSGLAGDSSGAVAVLKGLNTFLNLGYTTERLAGLAAKLGSDTTFFLSGGSALMQGRGEIVEPLPPMPPTWVVLMLPQTERVIGKTAKMYSALRTDLFTAGEKTDALVARLKRGEDIDNDMLYNVFEYVAYDIYEGLGVLRDEFLSAGALTVHLAGSGPSLFALVDSETNALRICERLKAKGYSAFALKTL
ncbi:MAG: 4-(cytidine 5'-diphospho)-2-C-methyl-D-erythritol kinase [Dehalococcoidales bacterium]